MSNGYEYSRNGGYPIINFDIEKYSKDKKTIADTIGYNTLNKMMSSFRIKKLPETIPEKWLKLMLLTGGYAFITNKDLDNMYAFQGGLGGEPDEYYQPTEIVIANPALRYNKTLKIDEDGILISWDTMRQGIIPIIGKYAGLLAENTITIRISDIMARITNIISASDDDTVSSADEYLKQLEDGKLGIIQYSPFLEDLHIQAGTTANGQNHITELIELEQYLKSSLLNEIGLQSNYNMKRESINSNEAQLNDDTIQPYMDMVEDNLILGFNKVNEMFGTEIEVEFGSAWKKNAEERELELEEHEAEVEQTEAEVEQIEVETENIESEDNENENIGETDDQTEISNIGDSDIPEDTQDSELAD